MSRDHSDRHSARRCCHGDGGIKSMQEKHAVSDQKPTHKLKGKLLAGKKVGDMTCNLHRGGSD